MEPSPAEMLDGGPRPFTWKRIGAKGPGGRRDHSLSADEDGAVAYLFAGRKGGAALDDLWVFDPGDGAWSRIEARGPEPRFGHNAAVIDGRLLVFGGQSGADVFFNDLWAFDPGRGRWERLAQDGPAPVPRYGAGGTRVGPAFAVSHGFTNAGRFDDTWSFRRRWMDISPGTGPRPVERCLHRLVHLRSAGLLVLFGGQTTGTAYLGDTWLYDLDGKTWTAYEGPAPSPRNFYGATATRDAVYLFGGSGSEGSLADLWSFDGERWTKVRTRGKGPVPRNGHDVTLMGDRILFYGGSGDSGELADTWELALG
jgi:N-acetylneuraminic acid mutarotase